MIGPRGVELEFFNKSLAEVHAVVFGELIRIRHDIAEKVEDANESISHFDSQHHMGRELIVMEGLAEAFKAFGNFGVDQGQHFGDVAVFLATSDRVLVPASVDLGLDGSAESFLNSLFAIFKRSLIILS